MKYYKIFWSQLRMLVLFLLCFFLVATYGQTTIILLRHAEKDTVSVSDPMLTKKGLDRAKRLADLFPDIQPDDFFSTNYNRTMATIQPWANKVKKNIQVYDPKRLPEFAEMLKMKKNRTIVIVGHSNTIPPLVNLLLHQEKYQYLKDDEYDKIFYLSISENNVSDKVLSY